MRPTLVHFFCFFPHREPPEGDGADAAASYRSLRAVASQSKCAPKDPSSSREPQRERHGRRSSMLCPPGHRPDAPSRRAAVAATMDSPSAHQGAPCMPSHIWLSPELRCICLWRRAPPRQESRGSRFSNRCQRTKMTRSPKPPCREQLPCSSSHKREATSQQVCHRRGQIERKRPSRTRIRAALAPVGIARRDGPSHKLPDSRDVFGPKETGSGR